MNNSGRTLWPILLLGLAFVFLVVMPMRARSRMAQRSRQMQSTIAVGTEIMTTSGMYGRVVGIDEQTVDLEIAPDVVVKWARAAVAEVRGSPAEPTSPYDPPATAGGSGPIGLDRSTDPAGTDARQHPATDDVVDDLADPADHPNPGARPEQTSRPDRAGPTEPPYPADPTDPTGPATEHP